MSSSFIVTYHAFFALDRASSRLLPGTPPARTRDLWPAVTIKATAQGDFGGLAAVERNGIFELSDAEPDFFTEFKIKLRQRRWIDSDQYAFYLNHIPLWLLKIVTELCGSRINFTILTTTLKMHTRASSKETASPAKIYCGILKARFYARVGGKTTPSKRRMSGGSLTPWGGTSIRFSVQGEGTHCGCCSCSIICS
jgi:hypothetical protein